MPTINNFNEAMEYVNRLGIIYNTKPIGWRQKELCAIVEILEELATQRDKLNLSVVLKTYPFTIKYHRTQSTKLGSTGLHFTINKEKYVISTKRVFG